MPSAKEQGIGRILGARCKGNGLDGPIIHLDVDRIIQRVMPGDHQVPGMGRHDAAVDIGRGRGPEAEARPRCAPGNTDDFR